MGYTGLLTYLLSPPDPPSRSPDQVANPASVSALSRKLGPKSCIPACPEPNSPTPEVPRPSRPRLWVPSSQQGQHTFRRRPEAKFPGPSQKHKPGAPVCKNTFVVVCACVCVCVCVNITCATRTYIQKSTA